MQMNLASGNWVFWRMLKQKLKLFNAPTIFLVIFDFIPPTLFLSPSSLLTISFSWPLFVCWGFSAQWISGCCWINNQLASARQACNCPGPFKNVSITQTPNGKFNSLTHSHIYIAIVCVQWVENNLCYVFLITYDGHGTGSQANEIFKFSKHFCDIWRTNAVG